MPAIMFKTCETNANRQRLAKMIVTLRNLKSMGCFSTKQAARHHDHSDEQQQSANHEWEQPRPDVSQVAQRIARRRGTEGNGHCRNK
jgi:hypothetical protein